MRAFTDEEIIARVESLPTFDGWKKGVYDIWVRSKADLYDIFDDRAFLYDVAVDGAVPQFILARIGTSNSGSYGLMHFDQYNHEGCAVLKADVIVYGSHVKGFHHHRADNPAYIQAKPWPYYRDGNRNEKAEEIGPIHNDIIGANDHRAGLNSTVIKNWSVACLVTAARAKYDAFLAFMQSKGYPALNVCILKEF